MAETPSNPKVDAHVQYIGNAERLGGPFEAGWASQACLGAVLRAYHKPFTRADEHLSMADIEEALRHAGMEVTSERAQSMEDLVQLVELGRAVILFVNAGALWNSPPAVENGQPNHAVLVTLVAQSGADGSFLGAVVRDPAFAEARFCSAALLLQAWLIPGGAVLTVSGPDELEISDESW